jgi:allantoicase
MKEKIIFTHGLIDLAQPRLGTKVVFKTDDFFASANRIISPLDPVFKVGVFDKHGKWMDGWESRRKRTVGHDYIILKLGKPGSINKVGNHYSLKKKQKPIIITILQLKVKMYFHILNLIFFQMVVLQD